jgi:Family of unknown function (DUF6208)
MTLVLQALALTYRVPLALASFVLFRAFRWFMRRLTNLFFALRKGQALRWRPLCAQSLRNPLALPVFMTSAPRWNPHAVTATLGPLTVRQSLMIDVAEARRSARSWSVVVYTFPNFQTITALDSDAESGDEKVRTVPLPPGRYWLGLRYYHCAIEAVLPAVELDGAPSVAAQPVPPDVNAFYAGLARRRGWFYFVLHYYVWVLLRYSRSLPARFVEREYLPVGNPGTRFQFGVVRRGERVRVEVEPHMLATHDVYLTVYSRSSLPVAWGPVTTPDHLGEPCARHGHFLVRIHRRRAGVAEKPDVGVKVSVE